jgi:inosine/xanthosine triphosphate pyrophosphatase family protein
MKMNFKILLATNNQGKAMRYRKIAREIDKNISLYTLKDLKIDIEDVKEDGTLEENARKKAKAYLGKTEIPILANDAGFYVEGIGLVKNPKRIALEIDENSLSKEEIYNKVIDYWKNVAKSYGGEVDAAWVDAFSLVLPDGTFYERGARREIILTDKVFGKPHIQFPIRALYISKTTNKPSVHHTDEEELLEVLPIKEALANLFDKLKDH